MQERDQYRCDPLPVLYFRTEIITRFKASPRRGFSFIYAHPCRGWGSCILTNGLSFQASYGKCTLTRPAFLTNLQNFHRNRILSYNHKWGFILCNNDAIHRMRTFSLRLFRQEGRSLVEYASVINRLFAAVSLCSRGHG